MRKIFPRSLGVFQLMALLLISLLLFTACGSSATPEPTPSQAEEAAGSADAAQDTETADETESADASEPAEESGAEMAEMVSCSGELPIVGKGPNGETATPLDTLSLTDEDIEKIKAGDYKVAISMHQMSSDWPILQVAGITDKMNEFGIEVIAVTDGEFKAEKQIADIESLIELGPDLIFMIPVDNDGLANVSKSIGENGIDLVLIDSKPTGLEPGVDYLGLGASDNYAIGADAAEIIAEELGGQGKVALLRWGFHVFQTEQRREGALDVFAQYPDIEIIYDEDVNSVEESTEVCENIMTRFPDTNAFWTPWDGPGTACMQAITNLGHGDDVVVTTVDLSNDSGLWIARDSALKGTAAQHPYDQGVAESMIALYALAGKEVPPYVVVPGRRVVRENVVCSMETVFHTPPDQDIIDLAGPQQDVEVNK